VQLHLSDPAYTERLAAFLESLGQTVTVVAPDQVDIAEQLPETELAIYLRVWHVLYPEALVTLARDA
jgi:fructoselysine-6-P-deglycase FrlB-like protein